MFTSLIIHPRRVLVSAVLIVSVTLTALFVMSARTGTSDAAQSRAHIELVVLALRPTGFEPSEITRSPGPFLLVVNNRSNNPDITLRLDHESGRREHDERVQRGKVDWRKPFDLRPGKYLLSVASHPDWTCQITITDQ